ncbi:hypothetical protein QVD17_16915 [Tagetes erecta]|uniref:GRF-type domain-containing protein n=1 Tax=Tagetes erecta TaxID=13708 RepID=A0AAD8P0X7_TARER|nr:hypothetical protein QVD17_16915 [Tagetes erecta]
MVFCHCGKDATTRTSWTLKNPGRRFYACASQVARCGFFEWLDEKRCQACTDIIPGLLRAKNDLESQNFVLLQSNDTLSKKLSSAVGETRMLKKFF